MIEEDPREAMLDRLEAEVSTLRTIGLSRQLRITKLEAVLLDIATAFFANKAELMQKAVDALTKD